MKPRGESVTRISSVLVAIISLMVAIIIPAGYFLISYEYMGGGTNAELAFCARTVESLVANNPKTWQFEEVRLREILEYRLDYGIQEKRAIRNRKGQIIAETAESLTGPVLTFSAPIYDAGIRIASIEVTRSIAPLMLKTVIVGAGSVMTGILIFLFFRYYPLRAVREAYQRLEENERRLALALEAGSFGVWDCDIGKDVVTCNDRMYKIFGVSRDSCVTRDDWLNCLHPDDRDRALRDYIPKTIEEKGFNTEYRIVHSDGAVRHIQANGIVLRDDGGSPLGLIVLNQDITDRKRAEDEQLKTQKLESVGTLAGGIAHDFNNLLAVIHGNIELLMMDIPSGDRAHKRLVAAEKAVIQAMDLTGLLITFAKGGEPAKAVVDIGDMLKNTVLRSVAEWPVETRFFMDGDLWALEVDERQMSQVIRNLAINAVEAMPKGGILTIRAGNMRATKEDGLPIEEGPYIRVSVEDTGTGIPKDDLPLIFDPYFSTKQRGAEKGMGLGLSVCQSVVRKHKGCITVISQEGKGTTFHVYLPAGVNLSVSAPPTVSG
ncbi:MAG: PAS domain-containing protein [Syntrophaceae bacterium]|nr:PAS domain-containing protein [Syntrophaceae bacterium]